MDYRISGLDPTPFLPLYGLSDEALSQRGIRREICDEHLSNPRVEYIHAHFARRGCFACRIDRA